MMKKNLILLIIPLVFLLCVGTVTHARDDTLPNERGVIDFDRLEDLKDIQARNEHTLFGIPGIVGIGIGLTEDSKDLAFIVYVEKNSMNAVTLVPRKIEDVPVRVIESGMFRAY
jgi:hypothetical protein